MTVYTVFTGGTISCSAKGGVLSPDNKNGYLLLDLAKQAGVKAAFVTAQPYTILSENLGAAHLQALRKCLQAAIDSGYDRIIVTHGTDTLAYTAAYLDLTLGNSGAAIVLVSANYPLADERSNGLPNFLAAAQFLTTGERGVFVAYRNAGEAAAAIHRGSRVLPHTPYDDRVFSLFDMPFGTVCDGVFTRNPGYNEGNREDFSDCELNGTVLFVRPYVGVVYPALTEGVKAVLLEGWHSGTLPVESEALRQFCRAAAEKQIPVFLTGHQEGFAYESKNAFAALGIKPLPPMSPVAAYMRLWLTRF